MAYLEPSYISSTRFATSLHSYIKLFVGLTGIFLVYFSFSFMIVGDPKGSH